MSKSQKQQLDILTSTDERTSLLPHLYGNKMYPWQKKFSESTNKQVFVVAANQIGKSSVQIRKMIQWATSPQYWPKLWPEWAAVPRIMWYLYPSSGVATVEFEKKWIPEFLPRGRMKDDPVFGWKDEYKAGFIQAVHFNAGPSIYFKTYSQNPQDLQTGTVHYIGCFTGDTLIITCSGLKKIKDITVGEWVLGAGGWNKVTGLLSRAAIVTTKTFSNGEKITSTEEHPFWSGGEWKKFSELTVGSHCGTVPLWKLQKRLFYLMGVSTTAIQTILITVQEIILSTMVNHCTSRYGKNTMEGRSQTDTSFITRTLIRWITELKILCSSQGENTQGYTNSRNGSAQKAGSLIVTSVKKILFLGAHRIKHLGIALRSVARLFVLNILTALSVARNFLLGKIQSNVFVLASAPTSENTKVYNLSVDGSHTYFANGILVHNCDEELDDALWPELQLRLAHTDGYISCVFTATTGSEFWRSTMEVRGYGERFPDAFKQQISMYDCLFYADGTKSFWTEERIQRIKNSCKSEAEIQRRVYGRFVIDSGLKYQSFNRDENVIPVKDIPRDYVVYIGVDYGSGGDNHPSAVVFVAVAPDFKKGYVFKGRRFDNQVTTASDVVTMVQQMRAEINLPVVATFYDHACTDMREIASRMGESWVPAEKSHVIGEGYLNVLFKNRMLSIFNLEELQPLATELSMLKAATPKNQAKDDYCDALRYSISKIPFDWGAILGEKIVPTYQKTEQDLRREMFNAPQEVTLDLESEFESWNELYDPF